MHMYDSARMDERLNAQCKDALSCPKKAESIPIRERENSSVEIKFTGRTHASPGLFFFFLQLQNQFNLLITMRSERIDTNPQCPELSSRGQYSSPGNPAEEERAG